MQAVLFDLDNTLYPEIDYVKSGFRAVSVFMSQRYRMDEDKLFAEMMSAFEADGRGKVFDAVLVKNDIFAEERVKALMHVYRSHKPAIKLDGEAQMLLRILKEKGVKTGVVTDGVACVQRNKIGALGLSSLVDYVICTDELGRDCRKPSIVPFKVLLEMMGVKPSAAVYIGDDDSKDFAGPNKLGILSVKVTKYKAVGFPVSDMAEEGRAIENVDGVMSLLGLLEV